MKSRSTKRSRKRSRRSAEGVVLRLGAFRKSYFDALYALELEEIERWLRNPEILELLKRQTKELLGKMIQQIDV